MRTSTPIPVLGVRALIAVAIIVTEIMFVNFFAGAGIEFVLSSAVVSIALLIQLKYAVRENSATPADIVVFIFNWLFLDLAPKVQLLSTPQRLVNTSSVGIDTVATTNLVCAVFMAAFTFVYVMLSKRDERVAAATIAKAPQQELTAGAIAVASFLCVVVTAIAAPFAYHSAGETTQASPALLIMNRFLMFIPSATLLIVLNETVRSQRKMAFSRVCALLLLFALVLVTENPYTEKRNALGPIYLGLVLIGFQGWFASRTKRLLLLVFAMVLVFPASTIVTHNRSVVLSDISLSDVGNQIADHYFSVNYDSWANIYTAVEIVKVHSLQWGHQLLGSLLFFVPSSIWPSKPLATGIFLANYLISNYSMWFTNLSAPLAAEGYLDFGFLGVVAYAAIMAVVVSFLNRLARREERWAALPMATYLSIFLMIIMRGSLMIAMGFAAAAVLSFSFSAGILSVKWGVRRRAVVGTQLSRRPTAAS